MQFFEMGMLVCFGASWPVSIWKSWVSKSTGGKSLFFLILVFVGYLCGITFKILSGFDFVSYLYILNAILVLTDILLYRRNRTYEKRMAEKSASSPAG